jgi:thymidylate synthase ThyX
MESTTHSIERGLGRWQIGEGRQLEEISCKAAGRHLCGSDYYLCDEYGGTTEGSKIMGFDQIQVKLCSSWGGDRDVANAAWASTFNQKTAEAKTPEEVMRVVTGCVQNSHDTPKERLWLEFFITCPIFIERQLDKYRLTIQEQQFEVVWYEGPMGRDHITQNELSGRYRTIPDRPYGLPRDVREILEKCGKNSKNFQCSAITWERELNEQHELYNSMLKTMREDEASGRITNNEYKRAREVLRGLLGTAYLTDMRITMNMNAFEHIISQRLHGAAQTESRVVAYKMIKEVQAAGICNSLVGEMIITNRWRGLMEELERFYAGDM